MFSSWAYPMGLIQRVPVLVILWGLALTGCQSLPFTKDQAAEFGDKTLFMSGCDAGLGRGFLVCRFVEGAKITSEMVLIVPIDAHKDQAEVRVRTGDNLLVFEAQSAIVPIPFNKLFKEPNWQPKHEGPIQILVTVRGQGKLIKILGYAYLAVLKPGYNPAPLGHYNPIVRELKCSIAYTLKGQSFVSCHD